MIVLQLMFSRGLGGLERAFLDHAVMLAERGHEVHCVVSTQAESRAELQRLAAAVSGRLIVPHLIETQGLHRLLLHSRLRRLIAGVRPDVIVSHGAKAVTCVSRRSLPASVPRVGITHNASPRLMRATHLIALTQSLRQVFVARGFPAHRIRQVPNALPSRCAALPRREGDALRAPLVVGVLGRMVHKKGFDVFLKGFRMALDSGLQARALIGGDGPERARLEALCRDLGLSSSVRFVGWVSDPAEFYEQIDICCVPSRDEPFGIVVLEGFAHGAPVLAAATGGPRELIQDGVTGGLFEPDNPRSLAAALSRMAQEPTLRAMRGAAYAAVQDYRCAAVGQRLEEALQSAVKSASKRPG